jgi:poly(A) polymerase
VLAGLREAGYVSYLVGGCVRDLILGREPKDFDVVTDARPEEIKTLFRGTRLIGRRFRLAHVRFGREIIEVATFRAIPEALGADEELGEVDVFQDNNVFGSQEEDALRRDFTINALYFDAEDLSVTDYIGGVQDLKRGVIRMIGDPETRFREDPVRMLRAVRFAAKLGFRIEERTAAPLRELAPLLRMVSPARLFDEAIKLFHSGYAVETYELLSHYDLFQQLFPLTEQTLEVEQEGFPLTLLPRALGNTDKRIGEGKPVTPAFLFAAILWEPVRLAAERRIASGMSSYDAIQVAAEQVLREQLRTISLPKRFSVPMREIWAMQSKFARRGGKQAFRLLENKRFRAAYDFLLLRTEVGEESQELCDWWTRFQEVDNAERDAMVRLVAPREPGRRRSARRSRSGTRVHT